MKSRTMSHNSSETHVKVAVVCQEVYEHHRLREDLHRQEKSLTLRIKAICRRLSRNQHCGGESCKLALCKPCMTEATALYESLSAGEERPKTITALAWCTPLLQAREIVEKSRKLKEKELTETAKQLPVASWVKETRGLGMLGLAQIIGEAGDLSRFPNPAKLWKFMGIGSVELPSGEWSIQKKSVKDADLHRYNPSRRSIVWCIGDAMVKCKGPYRDLYLERKQYEIAKAPELRPMQHHRRAKRYMEKRLLRNLWRAWRDQEVHDDH